MQNRLPAAIRLSIAFEWKTSILPRHISGLARSRLERRIEDLDTRSVLFLSMVLRGAFTIVLRGARLEVRGGIGSTSKPPDFSLLSILTLDRSTKTMEILV